MGHEGLVLVCLQKEWFDRASEYHIGSMEDVVKRIDNLIEWARDHDMPFIWVDLVTEGFDAFGEEVEGSEPIERLERRPEDRRVVIRNMDAFADSDLGVVLAGFDAIHLAGVATDLCVKQVAEGASDREIDVTLVADCCASFTERQHEEAIDEIERTRPEVQFALVTSLFR